MGVAEDARSVQERAIRRSDRVANVAERLWRRVDPADLDGSWAAVGPRVEEAAVGAVVANATAVGGLTNRVARADGLSGDVLVPGAFAGVDGSGRPLDGLLRGSVITTKRGIAAGMGLREAMVSGGAYLALVLKSAIADVERSASLAAATGKGYTRYVRLVNPGACSRCAVLAGSDRFRSNFQRHPACRCSTVPIQGDRVPDGLFSTPGDYFESLSPAEQDRVFTKSGAEAIRLGADPVKVVNARRGATRVRMDGVVTTRPARIQRSVIGRNPDGSPVLGYTTSEGAKRRVTARGGQVSRPRLMPESIIELTDDVEMRRILLRDAGYTQPPVRDMSDNNWVRERWAQQEADRAAAEAFYRSKGIGVG